MELAPVATPDLPSTQPAPPDPAPSRGWRRVFAAWPELLAVVLFLALAAVFISRAKANEGGRFIYTLDDIYIHMAIAKTLARHGIWGVSAKAGFSSGSSSLLWPSLLAGCFALFGVHEYWPLVLNLLAAVGTLCYAGWLLRRATGSGFLSLLVLLGLIGLTPLYVVASTGMEHCLQALLTLIFVDLAARLLTKDAQRLASRGAAAALCVAGTLLVMTRYEGLFSVAPVGLLLLCQRRWRLAVLLGVCAAAPITLFGLLAVSKGWYFLPNTLLLKGNVAPVHTWAEFLVYIRKWYVALTTAPHMLGLGTAVTVALAASLQRRWSLWSYPALFLFITLATTIEHLQFAALGWFFRYEAYLIVLSLVGVAVALGYETPRLGWRYWLSARPLPYYGALALLAVLLGLPLWERAADGEARTVQASYNVYEQQYQMGRFVRRFYKGKGVAANDIGAVDFLGDIDLLDLYGLTDLDVFRARRNQTIDNPTVRALCKKHHVELVVCYTDWAPMYGGLLPEWIPVGQWTIPNNVIVANITVTFFAANPSLAPRLIRELQEFSPTLPKDIVQAGLYCGTHTPQVTGTYGPEGDPAAPMYYTPVWAQAAMYPPEGAPLDSPDTVLQLTVLPLAKDLTIDVYVNDQLVETRAFPPDSPPAWTSFRVKTRWQAGVNTVRLFGHGTLVLLPNDPRYMSFRLLNPEKIMSADGKVLPQGALKTDSP